MKEYNIENIKNKNYAIHIPTKDLAQPVNDILIKAGGRQLFEGYGDKYDKYGSETCFSTDIPFNGYCYKELYERGHCTIISAEDFLRDNREFPEKWSIKGSKEFGEFIKEVKEKIDLNDLYGTSENLYYEFDGNQLTRHTVHTPPQYEVVTIAQLREHYLNPTQMKDKKITGYKLTQAIIGIDWKVGDIIVESADGQNWCNNGKGYSKEFVNITNTNLFEPVFEEEYKRGDLVVVSESSYNNGKDFIAEIETYDNSCGWVTNAHPVSGNWKEYSRLCINNSPIRKATAEEIEQYKKDREILQIGEYKTEILGKGDNKYLYVNGKRYYKKDIEAIKHVLLLPNIRTIKAGCNSQIDITLPLIEKIIKFF